MKRTEEIFERLTQERLLEHMLLVSGSEDLHTGYVYSTLWVSIRPEGARFWCSDGAPHIMDESTPAFDVELLDEMLTSLEMFWQREEDKDIQRNFRIRSVTKPSLPDHLFRCIFEMGSCHTRFLTREDVRRVILKISEVREVLALLEHEHNQPTEEEHSPDLDQAWTP